MIIKSSFRPLWWLRNPHLQTVWPLLTKKNPPAGRKECLTLPDGDFLDLVWFDAKGPLVIILHGLEGSIDSHYAAAMTQALQASGYQTCFMHFRGCGGKPNKLNRSYHSGETEDLSSVIAHAEKASGKPIYAAIGYSLGGNVLLKWLGEQGEQSTIQCAVTVSVPYVLSDAAKRMNQGLSKIYQNYLLTKLRQSYQQKYQHKTSPLNVDINQLKDFASFDDQITAPLHRFKDSEEYYRLSSSRQYLKNIATPTLLIHSKDDPFMFETTIPDEKELSPSITLEIANNGGHVGFISGTLKPQRWLEQRIIEFIQ